MLLELLLCSLSLRFLSSEKVFVKQCEHVSHINRGSCVWNCVTVFNAHNLEPDCQSDRFLMTCQNDGDCAIIDLSAPSLVTCESVLCTPKRSCINETNWLPKIFGVCRAHTLKGVITTERPSLRSSKKKSEETVSTSSWKCWSIIWAMGTFAVACFVLQCAAFNMYKSRRKRTSRNAASEGDSCQRAEAARTLFGQPQVLPSAPPMVHSQPISVAGTQAEVNFQQVSNFSQVPTEALQPQVVYVSDRPPAYEVVLQLNDHPPPYSSL